jgi:uncharacterized protein
MHVCGSLMRRFAVGLIALGVLALAFVALAPRREEPLANWWIRDDAHLLMPAEELRLTQYHGALLDDWDIDYRIVTVRDAADLAAFTAEAFASLDVGSRSRSGRGLLLVIAAGDQRVRLEVARELEAIYPDAFVSYVEHDQMAPFFGANRVTDGILATTELIVGRAAGSELPREGRAARATSIGAGAEVHAPIGGASNRPTVAAGAGPEAARTPEKTVQAYLMAMRRRDGRPDLDLYTAASRVMLAERVVTAAQMDNVARTYEGCDAARAITREARAAIVYLTDATDCAPWLLQLGSDGRWRIDFLTMNRALRFDTRNRWRLADPTAAREYGFAFDAD